MKSSEKQTQFKVGIFVLCGLALIMTAIIVLGGKQSIFTPVNRYVTHFSKVDGLVVGAKVVLGGFQVGVVREVRLDEARQDIAVTYSIEKQHSAWLRQDTTVEIVTQGVLGDKYLSLNAGDLKTPELVPGAEIPPGENKDISALFSSSEQLMQKISQTTDQLNHTLVAFNKMGRADTFFQGLSTTSKNLADLTQRLKDDAADLKLKSAVNHLNSILEKINHGQGSLGAFINDPALYDDAKALVGQVNRNRIMRNAIRQTIKENKEKAETKE